jgi:hypothetical protein
MTEDFDHDGLNNLSEFFFGLDPEQPDDPAAAEELILPAISSDNGIRIRFRRAGNLTLIQRVQASSDLRHWEDLRAGVDYDQTITSTGSYERVELELNPARTASRSVEFIRIRCGTR